MPARNDSDLSLLVDVTREAGEIALRYFGRNPQTWLKSGNSPVSEADLAIDLHLRKTLCKNRPDYGWLSEESEDDPARQECADVFIVDPIDGTRGFLSGSDDWTISVAIVTQTKTRHDQPTWRPSAACLFNPVRGELFQARPGGGAYMNDVPLRVAEIEQLSGARISANKSLFEGLSLDVSGAKRHRYISSLAYRVARVAMGSIDAVIARPNSHDWDLAAADLLLEEAGGVLLEDGGGLVGYNRPSPNHGVLIGANPELASTVAEKTAFLTAGGTQARR